MNGDNFNELKQTIIAFSDIIKELESDVQKCEKVQLTSFSYLYNNAIDNKNEIISLIEQEKTYSDDKIFELKDRIERIENTLSELCAEKTPKKRHKRPFFYFITKHIRYYKLKKRKIEIREYVEKINEQRKQEELMRKKIEEENKRKRKTQSQKQIKDILSSLK